MNVSAISSLLSTEPASTGGEARTVSTAEAERNKVGAQFEAILVRQMIGPSLEAALGGGGEGGGGGTYSYLMTDTLANQLTAGSGLGIGKMLARQLAPRGTLASTPDSP